MENATMVAFFEKRCRLKKVDLLKQFVRIQNLHIFVLGCDCTIGFKCLEMTLYHMTYSTDQFGDLCVGEPLNELVLQAVVGVKVLQQKLDETF